MAIKYKEVAKKDPRDTGLPAKYYGQAIHPDKIGFKQLSIEIADSSTTVSEGDAYAVLITASKLIRNYLEKSYIVELEDIGRFSINISTEGVAEEGKFHQGLIKGAKVIFKSGTTFTKMLKNLVYEKVKSST